MESLLSGWKGKADLYYRRSRNTTTSMPVPVSLKLGNMTPKCVARRAEDPI